MYYVNKVIRSISRNVAFLKMMFWFKIGQGGCYIRITILP